MAEKQLAYRAGGKDEFFADDDPLAELARIVGFDQRPATPVAANQRQEPAFDLEDELLREFERYDAPRPTPAPEPAPQAAEPAPVYHDAGTAPEPLPTAEAYSAPEPEAVYEEPVSEDFAAPVAGMDASKWDPAEESWDSVIEPATMPIDATPVEAPVATVSASDSRDLIDELELSIGSAPDIEPAAAKTQQWAAATIRLPLANFNAARREPPAIAEPAVQAVFEQPAPAADFVPPATLAYPAELDRHEFTPVEAPAVAEPAPVDIDASGFDLMAATRDGAVQADAALTEPAYAPVAPAANYPGLDIDDLLADVSRYPVPSRQQIAARLEPSTPAAPAPAPAEIAAAPAEVSVPVSPAVAEAAEEVDSFDDHDFDMDLADIELELAELDFADPKSVLATETPLRPGHAAIDDWLQPSPSSASAPAPVAPVVGYPAAALASVSPAATAPASYAAEIPADEIREPILDIDQELPFDPSEISDTEDRVESFEDMHVPALPPAEPNEPVAAAPDYDFDIDAEMASLFHAPAETPAEPLRTAPIAEAASAAGFAAAAGPVRGVTMQQKPSEGLDEFERALEEDFRRSFRETSGRPDNAAPVMFESSHTANDRWRARSMRGLAIAAAAIVVISGSAYGMYKWVGHNGSPLSFASGEPRVITADKDPVKVVPADPGGKIVPNQDKAVYDRVAGAATQPPKQKELVTSDEQPVDVVQKTLIPENSLPDDSDGSAETEGADNQSTPVGETADPRLLPGQGNATAASGQDGNPAVAPRRVRTMIVKPDGSLVAREEAPPADDKPSKPVTATKPAAANTQMAAADTGDAPSADSAPIRMVKTTQLANTPAIAPSATDTTATAPSAATDAAPIPTARPTQAASAQPAAIPPAGNATPAAAKPVVAVKPPVAAKPVQVASATPNPAKTTPAAVASAGGYVMQIASLPSEEEAKRSQVNLASKFGSVIGGHPIEVRKVDIAGRGTYYRVRVAVGSKDDAAALCVKFRAAGGTCLISK